MKALQSMSKTILITGASSGFGRDTAETLFRAGHTVYASMRGAQGKNREAAEALRKLGIMTVELDVSDDASVEAGVKKVLAEAGKIDVLINNAGIGSAGVTEAFTAEQAEVVFETNVIGLLRVTRAVLPSMRENRDGLIINIGSVLGRVTFPFFGIYGASKFAVEALTDSLRYEVSQLGVEVVVVQPSAYPTNFLTSIQMPAGTEVTKSYGEVGQIPQVILIERKPAHCLLGSVPPDPDQISVEGHLRTGRSVEAKRSLIERIVEAVPQAAAMPKSHVWAHLVDMPATQIVEFGRVVPEPGGEAAWIAALPEAERKEIEAIGRVRRAS